MNVKNADSLVSEMAAFANTNGGTTFIDVADDGDDHDGCLFTATVHRKTGGRAGFGEHRTGRFTDNRHGVGENVEENVGQNHLFYQR